MADARRLAEIGFAPPLAKELAAQIDAGFGNARRLMEFGMVAALAVLVASFIGSTAIPGKLAALGMTPMQAVELAKQIAAGVPFGALRSPIDFRVLLSPIDGRVLLRAA